MAQKSNLNESMPAKRIHGTVLSAVENLNLLMPGQSKELLTLLSILHQPAFLIILNSSHPK